MTLTRMFLAVFVSVLLVACGKEKKETETQEPVVVPQPIEQQNNADALFDEFFEESSSKQQEMSTNTETKSAVHDVTFSPNGRYVVQVSTIASSTLADEIAKKLEKNGFPAYVVSVENPTSDLIGTYYRVRIGGFDNSADAKYFGENMLRPLGYNFWVDSRANDKVGIGGSQTVTDYPQATDYDAVKEENWAPAETPAPVQEPSAAPSDEIQPAPAGPEAGSGDNWETFDW